MDGRALLLLLRARAIALEDTRAVTWLSEACATSNRALLAAVHNQARRCRATGAEEWDRRWAQATGQPVPEWLTVPPDNVAVAKGWVDTPTYDDERDYLAAHPELLDPAADVAVTEALLPLGDEDAQRYRQIHDAARKDGVEAAYRPLMLLLLASRFAAADPAEQHELIRTRRADLLDPIVSEHLAAAADSSDDAVRALALLSIAASGQQQVLDDTVDALGDHSLFEPLLDSVIRQPTVEATTPQAIATLALHTARTQADAAAACLYLAIGSALAGEPEEATDTVRQARAGDPDAAPRWVAYLAEIGALHPAVLPLIATLVSGEPGDEH